MVRITSSSRGLLDCRARVIAFPFAGGGETGYENIAKTLAKDIAFVTISLAGRGRLQDAPPPDHWDELIDDLLAEVTQLDDGKPLFFFGHSFGALLAYEIARRCALSSSNPPVGIFLSAYPAPSTLNPRRQAGGQTHRLPDPAFIEAIRQWGFFPDGILDDEVVLRYILPPLRADLRLDETYEYEEGPVLKMGGVVYGGMRDASVSSDSLNAWRLHFASGQCNVLEQFEGNHFYFHDPVSCDALCRSMAGHIDRLLSARAQSVIHFAPPDHSTLSDCIEQTPEWPRDCAVLSAITHQAQRTPDALALKDGALEWSYASLLATAAQLGNSLSKDGVGRGDIVGVFLPHNAAYVIAILGAWSVGATVCLLEKAWPDSLVAEFTANCRVRRIMTSAALAQRLSAHLPAQMLTVVPESGYAQWAPVEHHPDDIAFISLTSGSTGKPKAVQTTHAGTAYCFYAREALYPYREDEREGLNVFFAWECLRPLMFGHTAVAIPDEVIFDPPRLLALLKQERITRLVVTPSLLESVLDFPGLQGEVASQTAHMSVWFLMGEVVPARLVEKAAHIWPEAVQLVNAYSTWESLDIAYGDLLPLRTQDATAMPVGRPLPGCTVAILDDSGCAVPAGMEGELYIAAPGLSPGYLDDPVKTAERFITTPPELGAAIAARRLYRSGDCARMLPDGQLAILGRIDSTVKIRGFKVPLRSVESVLDAVAGIAKSLVLPINDPSTEQPAALAAYVVGNEGIPSETTLARLRHQARAKLPEYAVPAYFIGLEQFPLRQGGSRKLDKSALPVPAFKLTERAATAAQAPMAGLARQIAALWCEVLDVTTVEHSDHFFEQGGNSLAAARLTGLLSERLGLALAVVDIYQHSTFEALVHRCQGMAPAPAPVSHRALEHAPAGALPVAIIGMAGRFPGAPSIDAFWQNLVAGVDSLTLFERDTLLAKGVPAAQIDHPAWVPAGQVVADADKFDAPFFGIGQREATLMDPQHRLFMEVAWTALEESGYARSDNPYRERTGVFASCGIDGYLMHHLQGGGLKVPLDPGRLMLTEIGNEKDYIATRVAYQLDLGGPAVSVGSACSSALAAVVQAAQAITCGQCDMAVAGASALSFPNFGICYEDGLVGSVDGRVRPFDAKASGTLFGDSVGAVVLKRMDLALADGDEILAVLTGASMSNDGRMKASYTAPSAQAQKRCIVEAIRMAGIASDQISYVECHATATLIGDAIELKGLSDAFDETRAPDSVVKPASCSISSVKGNIGHANAAAGITGLIKTVLQLRHRRLAATVNFDTLNPKLVPYVEHDASAFVVQRGSADWIVADPARQLPRRAGVSSFGIGGTNAHVVLEEAPSNAVPAPDNGVARPIHLITASARSHSSLARHLVDLARTLENAAPADVAHMAYTLHVAREAHSMRVAVSVPADGEAAAARLRACAAALLAEHPRTRARATVAFCFSGQGSQHVGMARSLYRTAAEGGRFRKHFELACAAVQRTAAIDLAPLVMDGDEATLHRPLVTQCGLFAIEYALAAMLEDYGVRPVAVAGHSIGQYAAAVIGGALTLDQASTLVAIRAMATEALRTFPGPEGIDVQGGMLAVSGDEATIMGWLDGRADVSLAVRNAPGVLVLAGLAPALEHARGALSSLGCQCRTVPVTHPFHTAYMQPVADALAAAAVTGLRPRIPMACNVAGGWLRDDLATSDYWARHMTAPVLWADNVEALLQWQPDVIVEIGPGAVLTRLVKKCLPSDTGDVAPVVLSSLPPAADGIDDALHFSDMLGRLWASGVAIDWRAYHSGEIAPGAEALTRRRIPTYPFESSSYWVLPEASIYVTTPLPSLPQPAQAVSSAWLTRLTPNSRAQAKLYCFPYAGGSSRSFEAWARMAPDWLDVVAIEWPGRSTRADEPLASGDDEDAVALGAIATAIAADAGELPAVFCGLSYGTTAAIELLAGPLSEWAADGRVKGMVVVGRAPLTISNKTQLDPEELLLVSPELRFDPVWQENFRPVLDADLAADERAARRILRRWSNADHQPLVAVPLQIHGGENDPSFDWHSAHQWAWLTAAAEIQTYAYPGEHNFMIRFQAKIWERIVKWMAPDYRVPAPAPAPLYAVQWRPLAAASRDPMHRVRFIAGQEASAAAWLAPRLQSDDACAALICERADDDRYGVEQSIAFVTLWQALMSRECRGTLCLLLPSDAASGPISGAAKVAAAEYAPLRVQLAFADDHSDLSDHSTPDTWASRLSAAAAAYAHEPHVWQTGARTFAPRLAPYTGAPLPPGSLAASDGNYLITGATGGLGVALIDWLIDDQAIAPERIVVVKRSAGEAYRRVRSVCADLTCPAALQAALAPVTDIEGIFHLAGILDDAMIGQMDSARMRQVQAPKLALESLLEHASRWRAQWAVAFSSTSSLMGVPGQANYAAANAWLDHLASWPPSGAPVPVLSIHWGTWAEAGMSTKSARALERAAKDGERALRTRHALAALSCALAGLLGRSLPSHRLAVCDIDWPNCAWRDQPLVSGLLEHSSSAATPSLSRASSSPQSGFPQVPAAEPDKTVDADPIRRFLEQYVSRWIEPLTLSEHGLDSLDLAQLRNGLFKHFGMQIPLSELSRTDLTLGRLAQRLRGISKSDAPAVSA